MEVPECPNPAHAGSVRVRAGWYGRAGQRRQRWWCTPADGSPRHRFTEVLPRLSGCGEATCPECATTLEAWEGQPAPRLYGFSVRTVATALARIATGASFRSTAALIRTEARRLRPVPEQVRGRKFYDPNRHAQLVSDWVAVFAPVIWQAHAPTTWPGRLLLDEFGFRAGASPANLRGTPLFSVLGAVGYPAAGARPRVWRLEAVSTANSWAWQEFLGTLSGRPEVVVTDGGPALAKAVPAVWPQVPVRRCEWHLMRALTSTLPEPVRTDPGHPVTRAAAWALRSPVHWRELEEALEPLAATGQLPATRAWVARHREAVQAQITDRDPLGPHTLGPVEELFRHLDNLLDDRAHLMTNKARTDRLLMLLAADRNGWTDERAWAELLRDHLHQRAGLADRQRQVTDPAHSPSLR